jgi:tetratricopeptide (TPR) repeat protein
MSNREISPFLDKNSLAQANSRPEQNTSHNITHTITHTIPRKTQKPGQYLSALAALLLISLLAGACNRSPATPTPTAAPTNTPPAASLPPIEIEYAGGVFDLDGTPIVGAKISLEYDGVPVVVYTDSNGTFSFKVNLTAATPGGRLRVEAPGYRPYDRFIELDPASTQLEEIRLTPRAPTPTPLPKMTGGRVKVAVTAIGYRDQNVVTPLSNQEAAENFGATIHSAMQDEANRNFTGVNYDYIKVGWYPSEVIEGDNQNAQEQDALRLAQEIGANVVVYGSVAAENDKWSLQLYFYYVDPEIHTQPDSVSTSHILGEAIPLDNNPITAPERAILEIPDELYIRARALTWIAAGLHVDSVRDWKKALDFFLKGQHSIAENQVDDPELQAVFYYFVGREELWLRRYEDATSNIELAIAANPDYANAYHALGVIYFDRAQIYFSQNSNTLGDESCAVNADRAAAAADEDVAWEYTVEAQRALTQTLELAEQVNHSKWSHVASVAHLTLGLVQQLQAQVFFYDGQLSDVEPLLNMAKTHFETARVGFSAAPPRNTYIGWSHLALGLYYSIRADLAAAGVSTDGQTRADLLHNAIDQYNSCIRFKTDTDTYFNKQVIDCGCTPYKAEAEEKLTQ